MTLFVEEIQKNGKTVTLQINDKWFADEYPDMLKYIPKIKPQPEHFAAMANSAVKNKNNVIPTIWQRHQGTFWIYAEKGNEIDFTAAIRRVGKSELSDSNGTLTFPSNTANGTVKKLIIPKEYANKFDYKLNAPETGVYVLSLDVKSHAVRLVECNHPVVIPADALNLVYSPCKLYLNVPAETKEFGFRISGTEQEAVGAEVVNPSGKSVWKQRTITDAVQFTKTANGENITGIWTLVITKPEKFILEDFRIYVLGVPPLLSLY